mmetsp:Transcript_25375/g.50564  ORF Transcript_25375/g.50564 Transcript_25375/m.50564 type:complete len:335 (-) Transcript_25375:149-1153(-)
MFSSKISGGCPPMPPPRSPIVTSLAAGSAAGTLSILIHYPFDVLRTTIQSSSSPPSAAPRPGGVTAALTPLSALRLVTLAGPSGLYTGLSLPLAAQAVYKSTIFTVQMSCQAALERYRAEKAQNIGGFGGGSSRSRRRLDSAAAGAFAGAVNAVLFVTPVEYVRNRMILHRAGEGGAVIAGATTSTWSVVRETVMRAGIRGLWVGAGVTAARDAAGCTLFFLIAEAVMSPPAGFEDGREPPSLKKLAAGGAAAGIGFWSAALPLDTIKTLVQREGGGISARGVLKRMWVECGGNVGYLARRLLSGWQVAFGRGAPAAAVTIVTYEVVKGKIEER